MKIFLYFVICKQSLRAQHSIYCNNETIVNKLINHVRFLRTNREKRYRILKPLETILIHLTLYVE